MSPFTMAASSAGLIIMGPVSPRPTHARAADSIAGWMRASAQVREDRVVDPTQRRRRLADAVVTVALMALLLPATVGLLSGSSWVTWAGFAVGGGTLVACTALRREHSWWTFCGASLAMLVLTALPMLPEGAPVVMAPISVLYLVNVYTVVSEGDHTVAPLVVSAIGLAIVMFRVWLDPPAAMDWSAFVAFIPPPAWQWDSAGHSAPLTGPGAATSSRWRSAPARRSRCGSRLSAKGSPGNASAWRSRCTTSWPTPWRWSWQSNAALMLMERHPDRARSMVEAVAHRARGDGRDPRNARW